MPGEWHRHEVSELIAAGRLFIGDGYRAKNEELATEGLPFARAGNIQDGFRFVDADHFPSENLARVGNKVSEAGDVVFTSKGTVGRFAFVRDDTPRFVYSPQLCFWRSLDRQVIEPRFLYYWMFGREFFVQFKGVAGQTDMAEYVSLYDQRRMHITLPALLEQRAIAHILGTLDDKIELHRRMNETLQAMALAIFQSWFVDFDPVHARVECSDPGLPKPIADLFPDRFEDSELGEIPEGWCVGRLDEVLVLQRGFDLPTLERTPGPYPVIAASGPNGTHNQCMVRGPGVTTGRSGVLGNVFYIHEDFWPLNTSLWVKQFKHSTPAFAFHLLRGLDFSLFNAGSAVPTLNRNHVHNLPVVIPSMSTIGAFEDLIVPLLKRQKANGDESRILTALRDALLPKLVSGDLCVKDAERFVEQAT
jgi:type I restriction enzyme, S subunit